MDAHEDNAMEGVEFGEHTEAARRAQAIQAEAQASAEARRRAKMMVVPTDDREVRAWLRWQAEPVTLFGERAMERRERLRALVATMSEDARTELLKRVMQLEVEQKRVQTERFFTEGPEALLELRKRVCTYAAQRAHGRLEAQRSAAEDGGTAAAEERRLVVGDASRLVNTSSQLGGRRPLQGCSVSPDGSTVATGDWDGIVAFWTLEDQLQKLKVSQAHEQRCTDVRWHPHALAPASDGGAADTATLAYATASADCTAKLWNMDGACLATLAGHTNRLARAAFHPCGDAIATCSYDGTWRLWDVATASMLLEQEGHSRAVYSIAHHPDGSLCGSGGFDAAARIWDCRTGRNVLTFQGHTYGILSIAFSPNGYHVATGSLDNSVRLWDLRKKGALYCIAGHLKLVSHVQFDPIGGHYLLTTSYDKCAKVWSARNWQLCSNLAGHSGVVMAGDIASDGSGSIITASYDRGIKLWRPEEGSESEDSGSEEMDVG
eukprot:jgi/Ulvmu1/6494/UM003_0127.1